MAKVLIVEDDSALSKSIEDWLKRERFTVECAATGGDALHFLSAYDYDVIILDWELPETKGIEVLRQFRNHGGTTPILMLTARKTVGEKEEGFASGADDYLTKPFEPRELLARLRALLRRPAAYTGSVLTARHVTLDTKNGKCTVNRAEIVLQPLEFALLEYFLRHPERIFSTEHLLRRVWDADAAVSADSIYTCIRRLRKKLDLENEPSLIATVHSVGYKLNLAVQGD